MVSGGIMAETKRRGAGEWTGKIRRGRKKMITVKQFEKRRDDYFDDCVARGKKITISGLAYALGFSSVQSVHDYRKDPDFKEAVDRAYLFVEKETEEGLLEGEVPPAAGIFTMKARFGLVDKQHVEHSEKVTDSGENEW
jgi:hypothetical protein